MTWSCKPDDSSLEAALGAAGPKEEEDSGVCCQVTEGVLSGEGDSRGAEVDCPVPVVRLAPVPLAAAVAEGPIERVAGGDCAPKLTAICDDELDAAVRRVLMCGVVGPKEEGAT